MQETIQLFEDLDTLARQTPSEQRTKSIRLVLDLNFVELIQKLWQRDLRAELLEKDEEFPYYLNTSLQVICTSYEVGC